MNVHNIYIYIFEYMHVGLYELSSFHLKKQNLTVKIKKQVIFKR